MNIQLIIVVESDEKSRSDFIYVNNVINLVYEKNIRTDIKVSPVFMKGKGNYKRIKGRINKLQKDFCSIGKSIVIYCFDTDKFDNKPEDKKNLCEEMNYCKDNGFEFVWFCHDIEEVFLGESVSRTEKTNKAKQFDFSQGIYNLDLNILLSEQMIKGKSNLLLILEKHLNCALLICNQIAQRNPQTVGLYDLGLKSIQDVFRKKIVQAIIKRINEKGITVYLYEPTLNDGELIFNSLVINDLERFKRNSDLVITGCYNSETLGDVSDKVYVNNLFRRD